MCACFCVRSNARYLIPHNKCVRVCGFVCMKKPFGRAYWPNIRAPKVDSESILHVHTHTHNTSIIRGACFHSARCVRRMLRLIFLYSNNLRAPRVWMGCVRNEPPRWLFHTHSRATRDARDSPVFSPARPRNQLLCVLWMGIICARRSDMTDRHRYVVVRHFSCGILLRWLSAVVVAIKLLDE